MAVDSKPVTHTTAWRIRQYIVTEGLEAGGKLPSQRTLSEALGVSCNPLREVLATLIPMDVVRVLPGRGAYVGNATPKQPALPPNPEAAAQTSPMPRSTNYGLRSKRIRPAHDECRYRRQCDYPGCTHPLSVPRVGNQTLPLYAPSRLAEAVTKYDFLIDAIEAADLLRAHTWCVTIYYKRQIEPDQPSR